MNSISIVPRISVCNHKDYRIKQIVDWLIDIDAIATEKVVDIPDENDVRYVLSNGAKKIVLEPHFLPFSLSENGLEIVIGRQIFTAMGNGIDVILCPNCNGNGATENLDFFDEWASGESNLLTCPKCQKSKEIHDYRFEPTWGFSDLAFVFLNWCEFTDEFIQEFEQRLKCKVDIVYARH